MKLMEYRTPADSLAFLVRRWPPPISGSLPGLQWFFPGMDSTLSGSKKFFLGPFVSSMIGSCSGLQKHCYIHCLARWKGWFPRLLLCHRHTFFISVQAKLWLIPPNHILSRFIPDSHHRVHSINSHSHTMWCPDGLPQRAGRFVQCTNKCMRDWGPVFCLSSCAPSKGCQPEKGVSSL